MSLEQPTLPLSSIRENPDALRTVDKEREEFQELMQSISVHGVQSPILVKRAPDDASKFILIDGAHRYTACKELGLTSIPVRVMDADAMQTYTRQMVANMHVVKTRPAEFARQVRRMQVINPLLTIPELCKQFSRSASYFNGLLKLTDLEKEFQDAVDAGEINLLAGQALALLPKDEQRDWAERAATMKTEDFKLAVDARVKEIKKALAQGKDPNAPTEYVPVARMRKFVDVKQIYEAPSLLTSIIGSETDPMAAGARVIEWVLSLDPKTIEEKKAADAKAKAESKAKRDAGEVERLEKKKADIAKRIEDAKALKAAAPATA